MTDPVSAARSARENLAQGLAALQSPGVPPQLMDVAEPIAQAMSALHRIESTHGAAAADNAPAALDAVRRALSMLQAHSASHPAVNQAIEAVAGSLGVVHGLASAAAAAPAPPPAAVGYAGTMVMDHGPNTQPSAGAQYGGAAAPWQQPQQQPQWQQPPQQPAPQPQQWQQPQQQPAPQPQWQQPPQQPAPQPQQWQQPQQQPAPQPQWQQPQQQPAPQQQYAPPPQPAPQQQYAPPPQPAPQQQYAPPQPYGQPPQAWQQPPAQQARPQGGGAPLRVEAEFGAHSTTNFYKGLSGNDVIDSGGIFIATYQIPAIGQELVIKVSLPGGYEFEAMGVVRWTRDAPNSGADSPPGYGAQFTQISPEGRQLVYRYVRNREPLFHDDL